MPDDPLNEALPPQSLEAEQAVLGAMLLDPEAVPAAAQWLQSDAFYHTPHRRLFDLLAELYKEHGTVDPVLVAAELDRRGLAETVGGHGVLADLMNAVASSAHVEHYARIVKEKAVLRSLIQAGRAIAREAQGLEACDLVLERAQKLVFDIAQHQQSRKEERIGEVLKEVFRRIDSLHDRESRISGLPTGFADLDDLTSGLHEGELIIVAGRPSTGKTSFALSLARNVASHESKPSVAVFSMEQRASEIGEILACAHGRVPRQRLRQGMLGEAEMQTLLMAAGTLSETGILIDDTPGLSMNELRIKARHLKARYGVKLVLVDYLQLMESPLRRNEGRQQEISDISRGLKALARELKVPVVALSQLNRLVESREGHRPRLSDLRESGSLEQDADVVLLLYRKGDYHDSEESQGVVHLDIAKQRNGPTQEIKLTFIRDCQRFENHSRHDAAEPMTPARA